MSDFRGHASSLLRFLRALAEGGDGYLSIRNPGEQISAGPGGLGYRCEWQWHSGISTPGVLWQNLSSHLLRAALRHAPVHLRQRDPGKGLAPQVSFIIGHRGLDRLPQLLTTLQSIAGQEGVACECIVVEQDDEPLIRNHLPSWVSYVFTPPSSNGMRYSRSWAFNVGERLARSPVIVLHDGDIVVPAVYSRSVLERMAEGYEVVNAKRFIFYIGERDTRLLCGGLGDLGDCLPEYIKQNADGGGSLAITRTAYDSIGGMDERFIGWGSEDNEFWQRAQVRDVWEWGYLPFFHLWHSDQPGKGDSTNPNDRLFLELNGLSPLARIRLLRDCPRGLREGPLAALGAERPLDRLLVECGVPAP